MAALIAQILGLVLIVAGVASLSIPAALIVAGLLIVLVTEWRI